MEQLIEDARHKDNFFAELLPGKEEILTYADWMVSERRKQLKEEKSGAVHPEDTRSNNA